MKKISLMIILFGCMVCQLGCTAQAATPDPVVATDSEPLETVEAAPDDRVEEMAEAEREYQKEVAEIQREWAEEQQELREELAEIEQDWKAGEYDSLEEYNEDMQEYQEELAEAQQEMQEELNDALKELEKARIQLSDGVIKSNGLNFKFTAPNIEIFTQPKFPFSMHNEPSVLFIPEKPMDKKVAEQISEDMQVMSMILEKAVDMSSHSEHGRGTGYNMYSGEMGIFYGCSPDVSEAIYLEDYGMIFKLKVNFPLLAIGGDEQPKKQAEEDVQDEVWQRSKDQLKGVDEPAPEKGKSSAKFDPDKVELLKKKLIQAFKHSSNIRNLSTDARVVFVVSGQVDGRPGRFQEGAVRKTGDDGISVPTSVMTLQAAKQDIDAFAAGKLDLDKFTQKITLVIY